MSGPAYLHPDGSPNNAHPDLPDSYLELEVIAREELGLLPRYTQEYAKVPQEDWRLFPPDARLLLALCFASRAWKPDKAGGWYKFSTGLQARSGLECRETRRRAFNSLEKRGAIETVRSGTKTTLVRLVKSDASTRIGKEYPDDK